ncbi:tetratricopeptide repeat protein [Flavobacterium ponti]|uniref:Tetratricopeptide repeat protein n=1 Tax=Flavobacterium ponti TaxID=665133 RepID=A0ABV9P483_9FLAO
MKKIIFIVTLFFSFAILAQTDELKTLDRTYNLSSAPSQKDIDKVKVALASLDGMLSNLSPEQKNKYNFYKGIQPLMEVFVIAINNPTDKTAIINSLAYNKLIITAEYFNKVLDFEKNIVKKEHTSDIVKDIVPLIKPLVLQKAYTLNSSSKFKDASDYFYLAYLLDKNDGSNLENAAILSVQSEDYKKAEKLYEEFLNSDYLTNGIVYYAVSKANEKEETFPSSKARLNAINIGTHEKPRDEKVILKKPSIYKMYATLVENNGNVEKAKKIYNEAKEFNNDDLELLTNEANLYYNSNDLVTYSKLIKELVEKDPNNATLQFKIGYLSIAEDGKLVEEINKNLDNRTKYDELVLKRKNSFIRALPYFEKAYNLEPTNADYKNALKSTYNVLDMKEKADKL